MTRYLSPDAIIAVRDAALDAGLADPGLRKGLFEGILPKFVRRLELHPAPLTQVESDLVTMNQTSRLVDGTVPLELWLRNAARRTDEAAPLAVLQQALDEVARQAGGEPDPLAGLPVPELKERIVHRDDTVPFTFLRGGDRAGLAVARLTVPAYEHGEPVGPGPHVGTGWLITPTLMVTNHHVVNARTATGGSPARAEDGDLHRQARETRVRFDFESADTGTEDEAAVAELAACDPDLDYAVLRLTTALPAAARPALPLAGKALHVTAGTPVAVNIIQHPGGAEKRVALRNNLVFRADERDLRYFTDTQGGSSGSPVLTDDWEVVALHRGSHRVEDVSFQGKSAAFVNVGTQMTAVMDHLARHSREVHEEIEQAQRRRGQD